MVCDSNILIYAAEPADTLCLPYVQRTDAMISCITRIEVLGFPGFATLSPERQTQLHALLASTVELGIDDEIICEAIRVRQQRSVKLGDALIAATAITYGVPLVTRNESDFRNITGLRVINPFKEESG